MARIRTVKPDLFRHEVLQDLETANPGQHVMLVFIALFGQCDKDGVFLWNTRTLKLDILPFLDFDLGVSLELLREAGQIEQYEVGGIFYGLIPTFNEHQRITGKEAQSPAKYPKKTADFTEKEPRRHRETPEKPPGALEGKGRERKGKEGGAAVAPQPVDLSIPENLKRYEFEGRVIRLTHKDLQRWRKAYPNVKDIMAELTAADDYIAEHPSDDGKWFFRASNWLRKANGDATPESDIDEICPPDIYKGLQ